MHATICQHLDLAGALRANAVAAAAGLIQRSALLRQAQAGGRLRIEAAVFEIASGRVQLL